MRKRGGEKLQKKNNESREIFSLTDESIQMIISIHDYTRLLHDYTKRWCEHKNALTLH